MAKIKAHQTAQKTRIHDDWRSTIQNKVRKRKAKLTGPYVQGGLDNFERLLPQLNVGVELVIQRKDISALTNGEWSEQAVGKFLKYLDKAGIIYLRSAGTRGLGITLRKDLVQSPWKSRRKSSSKPESYTRPSRVGKVSGEPIEEIPEEPEFDDMLPETEAHMADDEEDTILSLDLTVSALDKVSETLRGVDLSFTGKLNPTDAAPVYRARDLIATAIGQVAKIRAAVTSGTNRNLEDIVGEVAR